MVKVPPVVKFPPTVIVLTPLFTPVPPIAGVSTPLPILLASKLGISAATNDLNVGVFAPVAEGPAQTLFASID